MKDKKYLIRLWQVLIIAGILVTLFYACLDPSRCIRKMVAAGAQALDNALSGSPMEDMLVHEADGIIDAAFQQALERVRNALESWEPDLEGAVNELVSYKGSAVLVYCLAKDKLMGTDSARERVEEVLFTYILEDAFRLNRRMKRQMEGLVNELEKSRTHMMEAALSQASCDFGSACTGFMDEFNGISGQLNEVAVKTVSNTIIVAMAPMGARAVLNQARRVLAFIVARFTATQAAAITAAAVDGPGPVGDMVGVVIEVCGTGLAAWELYNAQTELKHQAKKGLEDGLERFKRSMFRSYRDIAQGLCSAQSRRNRSTAEALNNWSLKEERS